MVSVQSIRNWEDPKVSGGVLAGISALFFALRTYTLITLSAYCGLVYVLGYFIWQTGSKLAPSSVHAPPVHKITISEAFIRDLVTKLAELAAVGSAFLEKLTTSRDAAFTGQIIIALVVVAKVGAWFSLLTLLYLGAVVAIGWPPVYKKYQHEIDDIYGAGKKFVQDQLKAVPGFVPKAEIAKKAQ